MKSCDRTIIIVDDQIKGKGLKQNKIWFATSNFWKAALYNDFIQKLIMKQMFTKKMKQKNHSLGQFLRLAFQSNIDRKKIILQ